MPSAVQTIISHVELYCERCPTDVREAMRLLRRGQESIGYETKQHGVRKVFYKIIWERLFRGTS
jgi:hypothetical protein